MNDFAQNTAPARNTSFRTLPLALALVATLASTLGTAAILTAGAGGDAPLLLAAAQPLLQLFGA